MNGNGQDGCAMPAGVNVMRGASLGGAREATPPASDSTILGWRIERLMMISAELEAMQNRMGAARGRVFGYERGGDTKAQEEKPGSTIGLLDQEIDNLTARVRRLSDTLEPFIEL